MQYWLDLGSGKWNEELVPSMLNPNNKDSVTIVHVDRCFPEGIGKNLVEIANMIHDDINESHQDGVVTELFCKSDIFEFLDNFPFKKFDKVICNRFFEHLEWCSGEVGRMIEACNVITKYSANLEFIVPDHDKIARILLKRKLSDNDIMIVNTEFCNIRCDPHLTIWTPWLAKKYINAEGTWKIDKIERNYKFAGRDIYMKISCSKPEQK